MINEVSSDYICDQNLQHISVYFTGDPNEQGVTAAIINTDTGKVIYFDNKFKAHIEVAECIAKIQRDLSTNDKDYSALLNQHPDGLSANGTMSILGGGTCVTIGSA